MSQARCILSMSVFLLAACAGAVLAQPAQGTVTKSAVTMPASPDPVPVTVKGATTALLVFDVVDPICSTQPKCMETMIPALTSLLAKVRSAGMFVLYSTRGPTLSKWLTQVAPAASDPVIQSYAQDRFYNTELDKILKDKGITTLILTGWKADRLLIRPSEPRREATPSLCQRMRASPPPTTRPRSASSRF